MSEELRARITELEKDVVRIEEQMKTIYKLHGTTKEWIQKRGEQVDENNKNIWLKLNEIANNQNELTQVKSKWAGIIIGITFIGAVIFALFKLVLGIG
jgi:uncharacterized coiled-coil DUF342 family protein|tara:strand:+ start:64 stop:357 length:294 start_codon:yes stop_codon:yes gene_type:complete